MKEFIDNKQYIIVPKFSRYQEFLALLAGAERAVWCWYDGIMVRVSPSDRTLHTGADMSDS